MVAATRVLPCPFTRGFTHGLRILHAHGLLPCYPGLDVPAVGQDTVVYGYGWTFDLRLRFLRIHTLHPPDITPAPVPTCRTGCGYSAFTPFPFYTTRTHCGYFTTVARYFVAFGRCACLRLLPRAFVPRFAGLLHLRLLFAGCILPLHSSQLPALPSVYLGSVCWTHTTLTHIYLRRCHYAILDHLPTRLHAWVTVLLHCRRPAFVCVAAPRCGLHAFPFDAAVDLPLVAVYTFTVTLDYAGRLRSDSHYRVWVWRLVLFTPVTTWTVWFVAWTRPTLRPPAFARRRCLLHGYLI